MKEIVITSAIQEDDQIIRDMIKSKLEGFDYSFRQVDDNIKIRVNDAGFDPAKRSGLTRRLNNLKADSHYVNFYNTKRLSTKSPGSASGEEWSTHIPKLANGTTNFMWNHDAVKFPEAIALAKAGLEGTKRLDPSLGYLASGITVYQFDTGYSKHPDIHAYEGYFSQNKSISDDLSVSAIVNVNSAKDDRRSYELASKAFQKPCHGTATAFTMIGRKGVPKGEWAEGPKALPYLNNTFTNNLSGGLYPFVKFVPILLSRTVSLSGTIGRAFLKNVGNARNINRAIDHAIGHAHIITMSMGGEFFPVSVRKSIKHAYRSGIIIVCAAGNSFKADKAFGVIEPAEFRETIAVSAIMPKKVGEKVRLEPWPESGKGMQTDISAPGKYIYTAYKLDPRRIDPDAEHGDLKEKAGDGNLYKFGGATSQATVHVASAAALWRSYYADKLKDEYYDKPGHRHRIVEAFRFALYKSMNTPSHWSAENKSTFKGILDAEKLLSPEFAPDKAECKAFVIQTIRNEFSKLSGWEVLQRLQE